MENAPDGTPRRKPPTKVKVVASRYAQALQRSNLDAKSDRPVARSSSYEASIKVGSSRAATSKTAAQTRTGVVSSVARTPVPATPVTSTTAARDATAPMSINDKLRLYRANKAAQRLSSTAPKASRSLAVETAPRPTLPERITPPTEKAPPRQVPRDRDRGTNVSTPIKRRITTPSTRMTTPSTRVTTPSTVASTHRTSALTPRVAAGLSTVALGAARVPTSSAEEELELLEAMYLQLCFAEATAAEAFHRQEQSAERQMVAAWSILQSKLQLLHDTAIRLDRELHVRKLEEHLEDQADALVRLGSVIGSFGADLEHITKALEASLQRMPTPGVVCSPPELKRQLEGLSSTLDAFQRQLQTDGMVSTVADALSFTQGMEESTEQICSLLLQVGHLLEEIQLEVNTETSLKAHRIQEARVQQQAQASGWW